MSPLQALAPDQRAVLELLLRQGRSYAELSEMLGLPEAGVRSRAHAALAALAPDRAAPVGEDGAVADWILGQQDDGEAGRTRESVARMPAWHAWATEVTGRLAEVDGAAVPDVPAAEQDEHDETPAPAVTPRATAKRGGAAKPSGATPARRPRPVRDGAAAGAGAAAAGAAASAAAKARPRPARERERDATEPDRAAEPDDGGGASSLRLPSSRLGGALLIGLLALLVAGGLFLIFRDGGEAEQTASSQATPTPAAGAEPEVVNEVAMKGVGNKAQGLMRVFRRPEDGRLVFALAADKMPPNRSREVYAVWFTKRGTAPRNLGFSQAPVGKEGVFTTGGPQQGQEADFAKWLVDYDTVVVARAGAQNASAKRPGPVVLQGTLPGGQE